MPIVIVMVSYAALRCSPRRNGRRACSLLQASSSRARAREAERCSYVGTRWSKVSPAGAPTLVWILNWPEVIREMASVR